MSSVIQLLFSLAEEELTCCTHRHRHRHPPHSHYTPPPPNISYYCYYLAIYTYTLILSHTHNTTTMESAGRVPRKLWEHPDPKSTQMWRFMQDINRESRRDLEVSLAFAHVLFVLPISCFLHLFRLEASGSNKIETKTGAALMIVNGQAGD